MQKLYLLLVMVSVFIVGYSAPATREGSEKIILPLHHGIEEAETEQKNIEKLVDFLNLLRNYAQNRPSPELQMQQTLIRGIKAQEMSIKIKDFITKCFVPFMREMLKNKKDHTLLYGWKQWMFELLNAMMKVSENYSQVAGVERGNPFLKLLSGQGGCNASTENMKQVFSGISPNLYPSFPYQRPSFYRGR